MCNIEISRSTFATSKRNTCNILMKHLKHMEHTFATCAKTCLLLAMDAARTSSGGRRGEGQRAVGHPLTSSARGHQERWPHRPAAEVSRLNTQARIRARG
jgi:hypothetical protein